MTWLFFWCVVSPLGGALGLDLSGASSAWNSRGWEWGGGGCAYLWDRGSIRSFSKELVAIVYDQVIKSLPARSKVTTHLIVYCWQANASTTLD